MKLWNSYGSEHSANMRIVGTFKTINDAHEAATIFNRFKSVGHIPAKPGDSFSDEMMKAIKETKCFNFSEHDLEQVELFSPLQAQGKQIVVETDEVEIQALLKVLIHKGAKVELYSKHDYSS